MTRQTICPLSSAISMALGTHAGWLAVGPRAMAMGLDDLDLSLPALPGGGMSGGALTDAQIRAYAALYYYGELEGTGLMTVAELLAEDRDAMGVRDEALYRALDGLSRAMRGEWYGAERRQMIFGTMLGLGRSDGIQSALGGLCQSIAQFEQTLSYGGSSYGISARLDMSADATLRVITQRAAMGLERAAQLLNHQLRAAIEVMQNPALHRRVGARDMWGFLQAVAVPAQGQLPDLGRAVRRAQSGSALIAALASARSSGGLAAHLSRDYGMLRSASDWLMNAPQDMLQQPSSGMPYDQPYTPRNSGGWA